MLLANPDSHENITKMLLADRMLLRNITTMLSTNPMSHDETANMLLANLKSDPENPSARIHTNFV
eukprot:2099779-Prymnesium_polylepis.2